jgi:hypothetical protein
MTHHIEAAVRRYLPRLASHGERPSATLQKGQSLQSLADGLRLLPNDGVPLTGEQREVPAISGCLRYPEKVTPALTLPLHRMSCVQQRPPPEARTVGELLLEVAWDNRAVGLTYGGDIDEPHEPSACMYAHVDLAGRPPRNLDAHSDATWGAGLSDSGLVWEELPPLVGMEQRDAAGAEVPGRDLVGLVITFDGAAVLCTTKKLTTLGDSSMANEQVGSSMLAERVDYARTIARALRRCDGRPVRLGTDNKSGLQVAMKRGGSNRARHLLRRYFVLRQRIAQGECRLVHIPDVENPSDFLTKFLPAAKLRVSLQYVTGARGKLPGIAKRAPAVPRGRGGGRCMGAPESGKGSDAA